MPGYEHAHTSPSVGPTPVAPVGFEPDAQDLLGNSALAGRIAAPAPESEEDTPWLGMALGGMLGGALLGPVGAIGGAWLGGEVEQALSGPAPAQGSGLGADVDALVARSPTLTANIAAAQANGWTIRYSQEGETGTYADPSSKTIVINTSEAGNPTSIVQSLAHETGHALYTLDPEVGMDGLTRDQYVDQNTRRHLRDEGEATITNLMVRDELMQGDNPVDIGVAGAQSARYIELYEQWKTAGTGDRNALRTQIGDVFAHGEIPSTDGGGDYYDYYSETYKSTWDAAHP